MHGRQGLGPPAPPTAAAPIGGAAIVPPEATIAPTWARPPITTPSASVRESEPMHARRGCSGWSSSAAARS